MENLHSDSDIEPGCIMIAVGPISYPVSPKAIQDVEDNIDHELVILPDGKTTMLKDMAGSYILAVEAINIAQMAWLVSKNRLADTQYQPIEQVVLVTVVP